MKTHKTLYAYCEKVTTETNRYQRIKIIEPLGPNSKSFFEPEEIVTSTYFKKLANGEKAVVAARVSSDSRSRRRHVVKVTKTSATIEELREKYGEATFEANETPTSSTGFDGSATPVAPAFDPKTLTSTELKKMYAEALMREATASGSASTGKSEKPFFYISPDVAEALNTTSMMLATRPDESVRVLMVGPAGYGKSSVAKHYAEHKGMEFYRQDCASIRDQEEWFGYREAENGTTKFVRSEFIKTVERGNCVVLLDEFNRLESYLHNSIYHLLEPKAEPVIHGEKFKVGENVVFVMTINVGFEFAGTFQIDNALLSRTDLFCEVGALPRSEEIEVLVSAQGIDRPSALKIVETAKSIRKLRTIDCSTRTTLQIARSVAAGIPIRSAFQHCMITRCQADMMTMEYSKDLIDVINSKLGPYKTPSSNTLI